MNKSKGGSLGSLASDFVFRSVSTNTSGLQHLGFVLSMFQSSGSDIALWNV